MIRLVNARNIPDHTPLLRAMHEDRKRVFVDLLKWDIPHDGEIEADQFDGAGAEYLILQDKATGAHLASLRLLRTERPHLMSEVFADLCAGGVPCGPDIREITRFCVAPRGRASERRLARNMLVRAMVEYGLLTGIRSFTAACDIGFLSEVLSAGWDCRPLGPPRGDGRSLVGALRIDIGPSTLAMLVGSWSCDPVELRLAEYEPALAA
ncbi:MAG TPA: acyl-homoserine-lactone synthase [Allosphingosinicella sp.]|nr:acyl-homoserine-lactone synthase [Allosphingosinicella sp.]